LSVDNSILKSRLIERWLAENHTYSEAEIRVTKNDLVNANLVKSNRLEATLNLKNE